MTKKPSDEWLESERRAWWHDRHYQNLIRELQAHVGIKNARDFLLKRFGTLPPGLPRSKRQNVIDVLSLAILRPAKETLDAILETSDQTRNE